MLPFWLCVGFISTDLVAHQFWCTLLLPARLYRARESLMKLPDVLRGESITRLLQGTAIGAIAAMVIGFNWGGWVLGTTAVQQAEVGAESAVVAALAPMCVLNFRQAEGAATSLEEFKSQSSYKQTGFVEKGGWAILPGNEKATKGVAKGCAVLLKDLELS